MRMASFGPILVVTAFHKPPCPFKDHLYFNIMFCINKTRKKKGDTHLGPKWRVGGYGHLGTFSFPSATLFFAALGDAEVFVASILLVNA